jgi:hypothetical protein
VTEKGVGWAMAQREHIGAEQCHSKSENIAFKNTKEDLPLLMASLLRQVERNSSTGE